MSSPTLGQTIIEKIKNYADVGFAVVLLTTDDVGAPRDSTSNLQKRARQNVIFKIGFFVGHLGRQHVCTIYENGVEIPSDFRVVLYVPFDSAGAWQFQLARELKQAGFDVDMNKAV